MQLSRPRCDDHLVGVEVAHARWCTNNNLAPRVNPDDLISLMCLKDGHRVPRGLACCGGGETARAATDDDDVAVLEGRTDERRTDSGVNRRAVVERRGTDRRVSLHDHPRLSGRLAGAHVRDPVDDSYAVRAVAGQAQTAPVVGVFTVSGDRHGEGVTRRELERSAIKKESHRDRQLRMREPVGSNNGSDWRRAVRRMPSISMSKPSVPGAARAVGT